MGLGEGEGEGDVSRPRLPKGHLALSPRASEGKKGREKDEEGGA